MQLSLWRTFHSADLAQEQECFADIDDVIIIIMANQEQPLSAYNVFHELQQEICDVLNKSQILTANNV